MNLENKEFNTQQIYVRSSDIQRTLLSTKTQLFGLFNTSKYNNLIHVIKLINEFIPYNLNITNNTDIVTYYNNCHNLRNLRNQKPKPINKYQYTFNKFIIPLFEKYYGKTNINSTYSFCDQVFSSYFEYIYELKKINIIGKLRYNAIRKINKFCIEYFDSMQGWSEKYAYYFYSFFNILFKYMKDAIDGVGKLKMIMIGGHESSVGILMNYLSGLDIIKRTEYPHFAFNIVFELRRYNENFFIEIYYNDNLKYNKTMNEFKHILDISKYTDLQDYCETFPYKKININIDNYNNIKKTELTSLQKLL